MKVKKGHVAVQVGLEEEGEEDVRLFHIPISDLYHPLFQQLFDRAREVYGYQSSGLLRLPCSVDEFLDLRWQIDRHQLPHILHRHGHLSLPVAMVLYLSFHACLTE